MDVPLQQCSRDPSQELANSNNKRGPIHPDFKHKGLRWIDGCNSPSWGQEQFVTGGLQVQRQPKDRISCVSQETLNMRSQEDAAAEMLCNHQNLLEDTAGIVALLKACAKEKDLSKGSRIHAHIHRRRLLETNTYLGNGLLNMYAKCGALVQAQEVFDELPVRNVVSWNALITGYTQHGYGHDALKCFERMQQEGFVPNAVTFTCMFKACGSIGATEKGEEIHAEVVRQRLLETNTILGTSLVDMYAKCGAVAKAQEVFDNLSVRDHVSWSALIAGYAQLGYGHEALNCYKEMQHEGHSPNAVIFTCVLKACGSLRAVEKGEEIHSEVVRQGLLHKNVSLGNALIDMYAKCGTLAKAQQVFDNLPLRDVVSWNALLTGYTQEGFSHQALNCFEQLQYDCLCPNMITFTAILKACSSVGAAEKGEEVHAEVVRQGLQLKDLTLGNGLVDMYAKCGALEKAQQMFDKLPLRDVVSWSALIAGYAQHGYGREALTCFEWMQCEGLAPNAITFICILKACGSVGAAEKGEEIHGELVRQELLEKDTSLGNALVDMYAKCGALEKAQEVFDELLVRDVVSWSTLIAGYAQLGKVETVSKSFNKMIQEGIEPNVVTFTVLLNACSHSGLVDDGQMYFNTMSSYGIVPTLEHHTCMVDIFGRAGHFDEAIRVIEKMPPSKSSGYLPLWSALLGACRKWGNVELGRLAFDYALQLDDKDASAYACMSSIYSAASMLKEADKVEALRVKNKAWKKLPIC